MIADARLSALRSGEPAGQDDPSADGLGRPCCLGVLRSVQAHSPWVAESCIVDSVQQSLAALLGPATRQPRLTRREMLADTLWIGPPFCLTGGRGTADITLCEGAASLACPAEATEPSGSEAAGVGPLWGAHIRLSGCLVGRRQRLSIRNGEVRVCGCLPQDRSCEPVPAPRN